MMLNGGELEGKRILRKETVNMMTSNQLPKEAMPMAMSGVPRPGVGFGLGFSVRVAKSVEPGVVGEYGWGGAASTHFWISPKDDLIVIVLQQYMPFTARLEQAIKPIVYDALK
jgi:CubicO group peptidase (beta-lactamase class C family)